MFWSKQQHRSAWFAVKPLDRATQHDLHVGDVKIIINCDEGGFFFCTWQTHKSVTFTQSYLLLLRGRLMGPGCPVGWGDALLPVGSDHSRAACGCPLPCAVLCRWQNPICRHTKCGQVTNVWQFWGNLDFVYSSPKCCKIRGNSNHYRAGEEWEKVLCKRKWIWFVWSGGDRTQDRHTMPRLVLPEPAWPPLPTVMLCSALAPAVHPCPLPKFPGCFWMRSREAPWQKRGAGPPGPMLEGGWHPHPKPAPLTALLWLTSVSSLTDLSCSALLRDQASRNGSFGVE